MGADIKAVIARARRDHGAIGSSMVFLEARDRDALLAHVEAQAARIAGLESALTPSAETKSAYIGEFKFSFPVFGRNGNMGKWRK